MLQLAIMFLVIALIAAFSVRRSGSPLLGRGEDTLRYLPHSRGAVFPGTRVQRAAFLGVTRERLSSEALSRCIGTHKIKEGVYRE